MVLTRPPRKRPEGHPVRLACIRHAASVDPEPGSNSPPVLAGPKPAPGAPPVPSAQRPRARDAPADAPRPGLTWFSGSLSSVHRVPVRPAARRSPPAHGTPRPPNGLLRLPHPSPSPVPGCPLLQGPATPSRAWQCPTSPWGESNQFLTGRMTSLPDSSHRVKPLSPVIGRPIPSPGPAHGPLPRSSPDSSRSVLPRPLPCKGRTG